MLPVYILLLIMLRPFQRFGLTLLDRSKRPIQTAIARVTLCFIVTANLIMTSGDFDSTSDAIDRVSASFSSQPIPAQQTENPNSSAQLQLETKMQDSSEDSDRWIKILVAQFAYHWEADKFSRCDKDESSRVVELNDYEIVELFEDESTPYGIRFEVKKCISPAFPDTNVGD